MSNASMRAIIKDPRDYLHLPLTMSEDLILVTGVIEYCFERRYNFIRDPDFKAGLVVSLIDLLEGVHWITQFPWMVKTMYLLPDSLVGWTHA
ncbi:Cytochrome P450 [Penicillium viridicatum]|nr:Cytochrome P450 [Penicillium viridicatum]